MKKVDETKVVGELANELLSLMGVKATTEVSQDKESDSLRVEINAGEETGLLIGSHGLTLTAIQSFLGLALKQKTGEWKRITVDIGEYKQKQEEYFVNLARETAKRAKSTGKPQYLYNLTAEQRRIIHMSLTDNKEVKTESFGEGQERYLVVSP
ncbi:hypothetical protein A3D00_03120 [Candidatus Woesebacteria bacterium RIFCSPHIGHO2_02_FULL_38_9]|uniref:R3H domain-containing protein n=1 Tax=Candidatus Woesebacteria bacterium RIFCSPHIGHO2_01_FULL_39_28 TaxID=1802496 RepID=A0A1F7YL00_9BACT|nr:MAG: hypothetical protein A2627_00545 [Candidatus Woesebacteria bacterium RIFCSPHIGHO2_01_FULL_39_28]OGM33036.1 MAG: hypothetical protein A3D00_03120 [Candidatus Woesebacteria bacterium RIFCSPHIGHO2_02_FULL_38_9]OGM56700.1 MAG: hypothetical protein A3A50_05075 [Candidatus Woesebacteria bacterium RIFCSPLOWO2_01_FULL_38_20]